MADRLITKDGAPPCGRHTKQNKKRVEEEEKDDDDEGGKEESKLSTAIGFLVRFRERSGFVFFTGFFLLGFSFTEIVGSVLFVSCSFLISP